MKKLFLCCSLLISLGLSAQTPSSADIYVSLQKLKTLGSVLYIAAHPDDENTRLLAWLAKDRLYRTGYLSLTRGDGGQNLIGDEQGIDLGLIRTQELLAARRIDGAEQYFTRAFDFGFTKTTEEALKTWDKEKVLGDVVWIIRKFQPDVIITRFPEDARAGHGHHSGSAVLAHEAYFAAADPTKYPEQLKLGVNVWQAKRIMWNTFNFGGANTTSEDQLKLDVGSFNPILGKSYGEIAAESRSQHKSQGFGVPAQRGVSMEYFTPVAGEGAKQDIMDGVVTSWSKLGADKIEKSIDAILAAYSLAHPENSVPALVSLYKDIQQLPASYWKNQKLNETKKLIAACSGLFMEAATNSNYAVQGDSIKLIVSFNNRLGVEAKLNTLKLAPIDSIFNKPLKKNENVTIPITLTISATDPISQPYWMVQKMTKGSFVIDKQEQVGAPQNDASYYVNAAISIAGLDLNYALPVQYKYTDPVKGELYQPLVVVPPVGISTDPSIVIFRKNQGIQKSNITVTVSAYKNMSGFQANVAGRMSTNSLNATDSSFSLIKGLKKDYTLPISNEFMQKTDQDYVQAFVNLNNKKEEIPAFLNVTSIKYDHIPNIHYFYQDAVKVLNIDLKTVGKKVGYIEGAGDKVVIALQQMGYEVTILKAADITPANLKQFDAIITGVRAYNVNEYMFEKYATLMNYVKDGGNLIVQYNTNNFISTTKSAIGPYPFTVSRNRVTDETAKVKFELPDHPALNYPNKITEADFEGWVQERGIYFAEPFDGQYQTPLSMADPNESTQKGGLIIADYGKGKFVYTGLVFFRELPAGVPGAYRLLANLIALNKKKGF